MKSGGLAHEAVESLVAASEEDSCRYGNAISLHSAEVTILCCVVH